MLGVNVAQLRGTAPWREQLEPWIAAQLPRTLPAIRQRCALDPLGELQTITVGLRNFSTTVEGSLVVRGPDPAALWACLRQVRQELRQDGFDPMWDGEALSLRTALGNGVALIGEDATTARGTLGVEASVEDLKPAARKRPMLRSSAGFRELYAQLDGAASGWFLAQRELLLPLAEEGLELEAVYGVITVRPLAEQPAAELVLDARLRTTTAERATRYAATAAGRVPAAARAAFTRLSLSAVREDVRIEAAMRMPALLTLLTDGWPASP